MNQIQKLLLNFQILHLVKDGQLKLEPDSEVATKFPNSPSGKGWTAQIRIGNKSLGSDGKWYKNQNKDVVHIPIIGGGE